MNNGDKMRSLLIKHIGMLEAASGTLFYGDEINYDDILSEAQEIVNIVNFIKVNEKKRKRRKEVV